VSNYPDGVNGSESFFASIDTEIIVATCPKPGCTFDGDVEADKFLYSFGPTATTWEFEWSCPTCGAENNETREYRDGDDD
jgi:hypothetical protein